MHPVADYLTDLHQSLGHGTPETSGWRLTLSVDAKETCEALFRSVIPFARMVTDRRHIRPKYQSQEPATLCDWLLPMLMNGQVRVG